ncbi:hypothetical protein [Oryzibacter oryziterrae]|uniref:hypothetical protein n=1 Tax=Oryzibacter oryziterrae TaxID=2766474 RepID=UPI001F17F227|nr:hypothetical protein [Oryzibacter oryziterrae]
MRVFSALLLLALSVAPAVAADGNPAIPACDDPTVLGSIKEKQAWAEHATWQDGVVIASIAQPSQSTAGTKFVSAVEHRHCIARAELAGGQRRTLYYVISNDSGFAGYGWGVEFCLAGHDPYHVYDANCRVLR